MPGHRTAIGFTVKSGWTSAVVVGGSPEAPTVIGAERLELSDPADPDARQPYHAGFGTAREAGAGLKRLVASVERFGRRSVSSFVRAIQREGCQLRGAGLVVGSMSDPATMANPHIRIHALEGQLFRRIIEAAATECELPFQVWRERDLYGAAADRLQQSDTRLRTALTELGSSVNGAWRAEQKAAALAAWLVLASPRSKPTRASIARTR